MNNCDYENEYRCSNGQCIDKALYRDGLSDCMDDSDEQKVSYPKCVLYNSLDRCEDYPCPSMLFSCGDGKCYDGPSIGHEDSCDSKRDHFYLQQMPSSTIVLFSNIYLIYNNTKPEMICFNETLCPYLVNPDTIIHNGLTCRAFNTFTNRTYEKLPTVISDAKRYVRSCSLLPQDYPNDQCSLFQCNDGSKCLSYHRIYDGIKDCSDGEDEHQNDTCSYNLPFRFKCDNGTKCISSMLIADDIVSNLFQTEVW